MHKNAQNLNQCSSSSLLPSRCVSVCGNTSSICECTNILCVGASQCVYGHPNLCFTSDETLFGGVIDTQTLEWCDLICMFAGGNGVVRETETERRESQRGRDFRDPCLLDW